MGLTTVWAGRSIEHMFDIAWDQAPKPPWAQAQAGDAGRLEELNRARAERWAPLQQSEDAICRQQAEINAAQARLVDMVAEHVVANDGWGNYEGVKSAVGWLTWKLGYTPGAARTLVAAAQGLDARPHIKEAFSRGELSLSQVSVLLDICEDGDEERLVDLAKGLSGAQLSRFAGHYRSALRVEKDSAHKVRTVSSGHRGDGSWFLRAEMASEHGAIIDQALRMAIDYARDDGAELDETADDPWGAEKADALLSVAESVLAKGIGSRTPSDRYLVALDIDIDTVITGDGVGKLRDGGIISARTARLLMENASIVDVLTKDGDPLDVGRKRRNPTVAMRRALEARDRCCAFPGCTRTRDLHAHHDDEWAALGHTKTKKMKLFCPHDHRRYHAREFTVEGRWPDLVFRDRNGKIIERPQLRASGEGLAPLLGGLKIHETTCLPDWGGEPGDMRYAADVYLGNRPFDVARHERGLARYERKIENDPDPPSE